MKVQFRDVREFAVLITKKGFSKRAFGRSLGVSEGYAVQLVNGDRNPGPEIAKSICELLAMGFDDLFVVVGEHKTDRTESA